MTRRSLAITALGSALLAAATTQAAQPADAAAHPKDWALLEKYCLDCHNATDWSGGIAFDVMTPEGIRDDAKVWEAAMKKMRGRLMPPPGKPQPDQASMDSFVHWMEGSLDAAAGEHADPGYVVLHRLNRTEYGRAIQGLLDLQIDPAELLPRDVSSDGFDNVASALTVSPSYLDQYMEAARRISIQAVGKAPKNPVPVSYRAPSGQDSYVEGLPLGTRGGMLVEHAFPADGQYAININARFSLEHQHNLFVTVDGVKVFEQAVGGEADLKLSDQGQARASAAIRQRFQNIPIQVKGGVHRIGVAFVARSKAESDSELAPYSPGGGMDRLSTISGLDIVTVKTQGEVSGETPSRRRIFTCQPRAVSGEPSCAREILSRLAREAYRRPVTDEDLRAPVRFFEQGRAAGDFDAGIQQGLMAVLASPNFLYRIEDAPPDATPGKPYRISDVELASRLSFFLWSQGPDDTLLDLAEAGRLREPAVLEQQVRRMLADERSRSLVTNFAFQWLKLENIRTINPDPRIFPEFDTELRQAFQQELELFLDSVLRSDRSLTDLLNADYTFVNERLALHYGIPQVRGSQFRRVKLADPHRWGLLGKGGILMATSYPDRTSPVLRGVWILENLTGTPPSAPPPNVDALKQNETGSKFLTVRERLEQHRANPSCNGCHGVIDPMGFALDNYDAIGRWQTRDRYARMDVDASGELPGGIKLNGPDDLRQALVARPEQLARTVTEKLMLYALGRGVEYHDMPVVRGIVRDAARDNYRFASIVLGIVRSEPFQMKSIPLPDAKLTARTTH